MSTTTGDIGGAGWKRYDDPAEKAFKLNAERPTGPRRMMGITGCLIHELLGVDALYPTGAGRRGPAGICRRSLHWKTWAWMGASKKPLGGDC